MIGEIPGYKNERKLVQLDNNERKALLIGIDQFKELVLTNGPEDVSHIREILDMTDDIKRKLGPVNDLDNSDIPLKDRHGEPITYE